MRYAEIKRSRPKVAAAFRRNTGEVTRSVHINVLVARSFYHGAEGYRSEACVSKRNILRGRLRCAFGKGTTPTRAMKSAVTALMRKVK